MAIWNQRIRDKRIENGITLAKVANKLGVTEATAQRYESGSIKNIPYEHICTYGEILNCSPAYLMGWEDNNSPRETDTSISNPPPSRKKGVVINVLGRVAAGIPIEAIEDIIDTEEITEDMAKTGNFFGLQIHGDSMVPNICDNDIVIVRQQEDAENGDVVIAMINGDDATCKRLRKYRDGIELIPNNPNYKPMFFNNKEIDTKPVKIIGKVVELRRKF